MDVRKTIAILNTWIDHPFNALNVARITRLLIAHNTTDSNQPKEAIQNLVLLVPYCSGCELDHLFVQCPNKPPLNAPVITPLILIESETPREEAHPIVSVNTLTRF